MPTPSNNGPDRQTPHPYLFSTCPDLDDQNITTDEDQSPRGHTPSSWHPQTSPSNYSPAPMDEDPEASRSSTMSPPPQTAEAQDHDRGEPEGLAATPADTEDGQKPTDTDEEMLVGDDISGSGAGDGADRGSGGVPVSGRGLVQDGVNSRRTGRRLTAGESRRRSQLPDTASTASFEIDHPDGSELTMGGPLWLDDTGLLGMGYEYADARVIPVSPSSYLRPGSRFHGTQQSERQRYEVQVEIKHVDLRESFLCGYLKIQGQFPISNYYLLFFSSCFPLLLRPNPQIPCDCHFLQPSSTILSNPPNLCHTPPPPHAANRALTG